MPSYVISLSCDPELYTAAKAYADAHGITFSRLVGEVLSQFLGIKGELNEELRAAIGKRLASGPSRALTPEQVREREKMKMELRAEERERKRKEREDAHERKSKEKSKRDQDALLKKYPGSIPVSEYTPPEDED